MTSFGVTIASRDHHLVSASVDHEHNFKDKFIFYRFRVDDDVSHDDATHQTLPSDDELRDVLTSLVKVAPEAMLRTILRKPFVLEHFSINDLNADDVMLKINYQT